MLTECILSLGYIKLECSPLYTETLKGRCYDVELTVNFGDQEIEGYERVKLISIVGT